tara:strand:+ start:1315 stop:1437 length:123 start_codon:yes stop_codon:yes gene_type:complete
MTTFQIVLLISLINVNFLIWSGVLFWCAIQERREENLNED